MVDTFVVQQLENKENFLEHINNIGQSIKFTVEDMCLDGSIPFLDILVTPEPNRTLSIVFIGRPPTQISYLHWDRYHHIPAKFGVKNTLQPKGKAFNLVPCQNCSEQKKVHIRVVTKSKYTAWTTDRMEYNNYQENKSNSRASSSNNNKSKGCTVVPYMQGLCQSITKTSTVSMASKHILKQENTRQLIVTKG